MLRVPAHDCPKPQVNPRIHPRLAPGESANSPMFSRVDTRIHLTEPGPNGGESANPPHPLPTDPAIMTSSLIAEQAPASKIPFGNGGPL